MSTEKEVKEVHELFEKNRKVHFLHMFSDVNKGSFAVLKFLKENDCSSNSGEISNFLGVSTARIAAVLKKLEEKKLIQRKASSVDARITIVSLTELGKLKCAEKEKELNNCIKKIIDELGMEKIRDLSETLNKINHIMKSEENKEKEI